MSPIRTAILEDDNEARQALAYILGHAAGLELAGASASGEDALVCFPSLRPDVVLIDIQLPGMNGIECLRALAPLLPGTQFMMLTVVEDYDNIFAALRGGATGYLLKSTPPAKIIEAVQELHAGGSPISSQIARHVISVFRETAGQAPRRTGDAADTMRTKDVVLAEVFQHPDLSDRESEVLHWLAKGCLYKEVAAQLAISPATVRTHVQRIYRKLHVRSKTAAASKIRR